MAPNNKRLKWLNTLFVFENLFVFYGVAVLWRWYQKSNLVSFKVFKLLMHGINQLGLDKIISIISKLKRSNKCWISKVKDMLWPRSCDSLIEFTDHLLGWMATLNVLWYLTLESRLPLTIAWPPPGSTYNGSKRPQVEEEVALGSSTKVMEASSTRAYSEDGSGSP